MRTFRLTSVLLLLAFLRSGLATAGAWTQPVGGFYLRLSANQFESNETFDREGDHFELGFGERFEDRNLTLYTELGLTDDVTLVAQVAAKHLEFSNDFRFYEEEGVGDVELGLRHALWRRQLVVSIQGMVKLPTYSTNEFLSLGNGELEAELRLLGGASLAWLRGYAGLEVGYRVRGGSPGDELRYLGELGGTVGPRLSWRLKAFGIVAQGNADIDIFSYNIRSGEDFDVGMVEATVGLRVWRRVHLEAAWSTTVYGRNTYRGDTHTLAVVLQ